MRKVSRKELQKKLAIIAVHFLGNPCNMNAI